MLPLRKLCFLGFSGSDERERVSHTGLVSRNQKYDSGGDGAT